MSNPYRRYEILLPRRFNDGTQVPDELLGATARSNHAIPHSH
jgi:hypothetical protein